jgi:hypothetical protein
MANNNDKRTFIQFELDKDDKEFLKQYVDEKKTTMSDFIRKAVWFFIDRDTTPDRFVVKTVENATSVDIDLSKIDKLIDRLDERDITIQKAIENIDRKINGVKLEITTDIFEQLAKLTEEIDKLKKGD